MLRGHPDPQRAGQAAEAQRRLELGGLAVDPRVHRPVGLHLELRGAPLPPGQVRAVVALGIEHRHPEQAGLEGRPGARAHRVAEPVAAVGDQHRRAGRGLAGRGIGPAERLRVGLGAERVGDGVEQRAHLGVAVGLLLDRLGVHAERDVVHEHAAVDLGQVDHDLAAVHERVERAHHVVAVDAQVQRQVVARAGRDARVGQPELGRPRGHDRLRAVPARHRQRVGAALHRRADQRVEVVVPVQHHGLDAAGPRLVVQREALGLAPAGLRVHQQHGPAGRLRRREVAALGERPPRGGHAQGDRREPDQAL